MIATLLLALDLNLPKSEIVWQLINGADVAQTYSMSIDTCFKEENFLTKAIIGEHPHPDKVLAIGLAWAVGHVFYSSWLENSKMGESTKNIIRMLDFGSKGITIATNHQIGIRITESNRRLHRDDCRPQHSGYF